MAGPVAAGVAALIKSQFNELSPYELGLRLSATADDLYDVNQEYYLFLGSGRVNAHKSVTYTEDQFNVIPVRLDLIQFSASDLLNGNGDASLDPGETIEIGASFYNYSVMGSENVSVYLNSADSRLNITDNSETSLIVAHEDTIILVQAYSLTCLLYTSDAADE